MSGLAQFSTFSFPPISVVLVDPVTGLPMNQEGTGGSAHVLEQGNIAAVRNVSSPTNAYIPVRQECNLTVLSQTTAAVIGVGAAADTHLMGVVIHTALTGTCVIDGFADATGAAQAYTIPAGFVGTIDFKGAINSAGALTFTASNAADDNKIAILWRPV